MYGQSFGTWGDYKVILILNLWLSRHLIFRTLCTGDTSNSFFSPFKYPSQSNLWNEISIGQLVRKYCSSGQYFDAPSRSAILSACSGGDHHHGNSHHNAHGILSTNFANSFPYHYIVLPLFRTYNWVLSLKQSDLTMFQFKNGKQRKKQNNKGSSGGESHPDSGNNHQSLSRKQRMKNSNFSSSSNHRMAHNQQKLLSSKVYKQLEKLWENLPPPQLLFAFTTGIICIAIIVSFHPNTYNLNVHTNTAVINPTSNYFFAQTSNNRGNMYHRHQNSHSQQHMASNSKHTKNMNINLNQPPHPDSNTNMAPYLIDYMQQKRFSFFDPFDFRSTNPGIIPLFLFIAACGTLSSLVLYGRVILPIPDLTSGCNVVENVQTLTNKHNQSNQQQRSRSRHNPSSGGGILSSMNLTSNSKSANFSSSSSNKKTDKDSSWAETYKSIQRENRLVMLSKVLLLRTIENVFVCAVLPQSFMVCKITKHCDPYPLLWERAASFSLDPWRVVGQHGIGADASITTSFESIRVDSWVKFYVAASVILTTLSILLAQAVTLDKGFLSSIGYLSGESIFANDEASNSPEFGDKQLNNNTNRRNKKGNSHNHKNSDNSTKVSADVDMDELNIFLRSARFIFQYDYGHPTTSSVVSVASMFQMGFIVILINVFIYYDSVGYDSKALALTIISNVIASSATCCIGTMDFNELKRLSLELSGAPSLY